MKSIRRETLPAFALLVFALALPFPRLSGARATPKISPQTRQLIEKDWERQEQVTRGLKAGSPKALDGALKRGRLMIEDFRALGADKPASTAKQKLDAIQSRRDALVKENRANGNAWRGLYLAARWAIRELAFSNPHLDFDELLFVRRHWPRFRHQCSHRVGEAQTRGANLSILKGLRPDGKVRSLLTGEYAGGGIGRPDLSCDGKRIVFPYAAPRPGRPTSYGIGKPGHRGGGCLMYDIFEVGIDGTGLKRLTNSPDSEDTEPCYLPDGRIAFMSSRANRFVQCGDWALACGMYAMDADGSDVRQVTEPKEGEFYPSILLDGRIIYTRWDYMMKGFNVIQQLWSVNPDGTGAQLVFGDHYAFSSGPIAFFEARQIPGSSKVICTGAAHHNTGVGPIMIVDLARHRGGPDSMVCVTPEVAYPEINRGMKNEARYPPKGNPNAGRARSTAGWYNSPYPLTENHFLVTYSFDRNDISDRGYGIYLQDVHGNKELIYRDKHFSCYSPLPVRPRRSPTVLPDTVKGTDPDEPATLIVHDVYQGLEEVARGTVRHLRILETHSKCVRTTPQRVDVGLNSGWDVREVLGTVPVEEDGSACFRAPPNRQLFLEALDKDYLEIRRMRNFMNLMPGETRSCIGCHESYGAAPRRGKTGTPMALKREPSEIEPPPWGTGGFSFKRFVQPVLDRNCTRCHDGSEGEDKSFDLRGKEMVRAPAGFSRDQGPQHCVSDSFLNLIKHVSYIRVGGYQGDKLPLRPYATGSHESELMKTLAKGHYGVSLKLDDWRAFAAWIDCNAPYYGDWDSIVIHPTIGSIARTGVVRVLRKTTASDRARIQKRKEDLQSKMKDSRLAAYLDCGIQSSSEGSGSVNIRQTRGKGWNFCDPKGIEGVLGSHADITFDETQIVFRIKGLRQGRSYGLGLSWWDYNSAGRVQSIAVAKSDGRQQHQIVKPTLLPGNKTKKQLPGERILELPRDLIQAGQLLVSIRKNSGANAVVSEVWIEEGPPPAD